MQLKTLLKSATDTLHATSPTPQLDAEILLAHALKKPRTFLLASPFYLLEDSVQQYFLNLIEKRRVGQPVAYLTGSQPFWSFDLTVSEDTLIPRPETEHLIELALERLDKTAACRVVDLGTGSGAIGLAIAKERPNCQVFATDISEAALKIAELNAKQLDIKNIGFYQGDWYHALPTQSYDLIVSNPPYIAAQEISLLSTEVHFEPVVALFSEENGLKDISIILKQAPLYLNPNGFALIEHGFLQGESVRSLFSTAGFKEIFTEQDYSGHERVTRGKF